MQEAIKCIPLRNHEPAIPYGQGNQYSPDCDTDDDGIPFGSAGRSVVHPEQRGRSAKFNLQ